MYKKIRYILTKNRSLNKKWEKSQEIDKKRENDGLSKKERR